MTTPVEKRNASKFCEFHEEVGHTTDQCMHLKRQIEEMLKARKLSHLIKELKQSNRKDHVKAVKKGETLGNDKPLAILMVHPWQRVARQRINQTFSSESVISFPPLGEEDGTKVPMIIEVEIGGHCVHRMYVDGASSLEILYEHCFNRFCPKDVYPLDKRKEGKHVREIGQSTRKWKKLVDAGIMKEVHYHSWLSNPVMSPSADIYSNVSWTHTKDTINTNGKRRRGKDNSKMSFRLKNAGQTYQRLVDKAFQKQIGRNLEVYVDDLVIKSRTKKELIRDIEETFKTLREINMKLNPKKYAFGMREGTFLGYKVDTDGLRVCPDKVEVVLNLPSPKCLKDVQKLNGKLTSLNRFLSKSAKKYLPFFKTLKKCTKKSDFQWTVEAEIAFKQMKKWIAELPMFTAPKEKGELIMYLAAVKEAISAVLMTERDGKQMPIYFVSRALQGPKVNYTPMEKLILSLVNGVYVAKEPGMIKYSEKVKNLSSAFKEFSIKQVPRGENKKGDALSKMTSTSFAHLSKQVLVEELKEKTIDEKEVLVVVEEEGRTRMTPIYEYLTEEILPEEKRKARAIRHKVGRYVVTNEILYKKSFLGPWLRCIGPLKANYVLREIHEGSCSMHAGQRSVVVKALRSGYYWPTMHTDARNLIRECNSFQVHRPVPRNPQQKLTPITSPWLFQHS
ncbi:reverse transcriptase domain-containing protein [Tanacetum coccineum]